MWLLIFSSRQSFAERNPGIIFAHSYPGFVATNLMSAARSSWIRALAPIGNALAERLGTPKHDSAEYLWGGLLRSNPAGGHVRLGAKGEDMGMKDYKGTEEAKKAVWEHTLKTTRVEERSVGGVA